MKLVEDDTESGGQRGKKRRKGKTIERKRKNRERKEKERERRRESERERERGGERLSCTGGRWGRTMKKNESTDDLKEYYIL